MFYEKNYKEDEPVNKIYRSRHGVYVTISDKFLDKLLVDYAIALMPEHLAVVAEMVICDHCHPDDVAEYLGIHRSTVYRRLVRAEALIREFLKDNK